MQLKLFIKAKEVTLSLLNEEKILSEKKWQDENNLLEKFFPAIEEILKKNDLDISNLQDFVLETDVPEGYTTERIARTIIQTLKFASLG